MPATLCTSESPPRIAMPVRADRRAGSSSVTPSVMVMSLTMPATGSSSGLTAAVTPVPWSVATSTVPSAC
jgi:hypothetical protein